MSLPVNIIVAVCSNNGIGMKGKLPWSLRNEYGYYLKMTTTTKDPAKRNVVVRGRRTWEFAPEDSKNDPKLLQIVVSSKAAEEPEKYPGCIPCASLDAALRVADSMSSEIETIWIAGGTGIFKEALESPRLSRVYRTDIMKEFQCDTFMPPMDFRKLRKIEIPEVPTEVQEENNTQYRFNVYEKI